MENPKEVCRDGKGGAIPKAPRQKQDKIKENADGLPGLTNQMKSLGHDVTQSLPDVKHSLSDVTHSLSVIKYLAEAVDNLGFRIILNRDEPMSLYYLPGSVSRPIRYQDGRWVVADIPYRLRAFDDDFVVLRYMKSWY